MRVAVADNTHHADLREQLPGDLALADSRVCVLGGLHVSCVLAHRVRVSIKCWACSSQPRAMPSQAVPHIFYQPHHVDQPLDLEPV
jgi:hypothetical protein